MLLPAKLYRFAHYSLGEVDLVVVELIRLGDIDFDKIGRVGGDTKSSTHPLSSLNPLLVNQKSWCAPVCSANLPGQGRVQRGPIRAKWRIAYDGCG